MWIIFSAPPPLWIRLQFLESDGTRNEKPCSHKVILYAARLLDLNEYSASFLEANLADKIDISELNEILINSLPISCSKEAYVQGFNCEYILFKKYINF